MKKTALFCLLVLMLLIPIKPAEAVECKPTISWKVDSSFYVGETGKLIATITNRCDDDFTVKTNVNTEKAYGYIKVYQAASEDDEPFPIKHSESAGDPTVEVEIDADSTEKVIYFIQPDEKALIGTFTLYGNFIIKYETEIKEISITVKKPLTITYGIPSSLKIDSPYTSTIKITNVGPEMIESLNICLFSPDNIVSFSEKCKSWTNLPSKYTDTFSFKITASRIKPDTYLDPIKGNIDYTSYTGLTVVDKYTHPLIKISATQAKPPSLSYKITKTTENVSFYITNKGEGTAYDCNLKLTTPVDCLLYSESITRHVKGVENNVYEIDCGEEIIQDDFTTTMLTFNSSEITPPSLISGNILFEDTRKRSFQTEIKDFSLIPLVMTTTPFIGGIEKPKLILSIVLIIIIALLIVPVFIRIYKKLKVKKLENYQGTTEQKEE